MLASVSFFDPLDAYFWNCIISVFCRLKEPRLLPGAPSLSRELDLSLEARKFCLSFDVSGERVFCLELVLCPLFTLVLGYPASADDGLT